MTTKTITIQKKGTIALPKEWLQKINQANKLEACFVNGSIILGSIKNEKEKNYSDNFEKRKKATPTYYLKGKEAEELDSLIKKGLKEYEKGETISAPSLKEALKLYGKKNKKN